jgi:hypothetical protein
VELHARPDPHAGRYLWRLEIDDYTTEPWSTPFVVR